MRRRPTGRRPDLCGCTSYAARQPDRNARDPDPRGRQERLMTTTTATTSTTGNDLARQLTVAISAVLAVVGSFIGSGAAGGTPIQEAAGGALAADATLIAPGSGAFSIWTL